jgi:RNA:NAD 2'-phosphotransferase (TPT1/KptA family)
MDTYIRTYMDEEGYVPVGLVCTYQNVAYFGCPYEDILQKLIQVAPKSKNFEIDEQNETIRLRNGWEKVR